MNNEIEQIIEENKDSANEFTYIYFPFNAIYQMQEENKQLKDNWNAIKNIIKDMVSVGYTDKHGEYYWPTKENSEYGVRAKILLDKMEEMERINNND